MAAAWFHLKVSVRELVDLWDCGSGGDAAEGMDVSVVSLSPASTVTHFTDEDVDSQRHRNGRTCERLL